MPPSVAETRARRIVAELVSGVREYRSLLTTESPERSTFWFSSYDVAFDTLSYIVDRDLPIAAARMPSVSSDVPLVLRRTTVSIGKDGKVSSRFKEAWAVMFRNFASFMLMRRMGSFAESLSVCIPTSHSRVYPYLCLSTTFRSSAVSSANLLAIASRFIHLLPPGDVPRQTITVFVYSMSTSRSHHYLIHFFAESFSVSDAALADACARVDIDRFGLKHSFLLRGSPTNTAVPLPYHPISDSRLAVDMSATSHLPADMFVASFAAHFFPESGFTSESSVDVANFSVESDAFFWHRTSDQPSDLLIIAYRAACIVQSYFGIQITRPVAERGTRDHDASIITQRKRYAKLVIEAMVHSDSEAFPGKFQWLDRLPSLDVRITLQPDGADVQILNHNYCPICQGEHPNSETAFHVSAYGLTFRCYRAMDVPEGNDQPDDIVPFEVPPDVRDGTFFAFHRSFQFFSSDDNEHVWGAIGPLLTYAWAYSSPQSSLAYTAPPEASMSPDNVKKYGDLSVRGRPRTLPSDVQSTPFRHVLEANVALAPFTSVDPTPPGVIQSLVDKSRRRKREKRPRERPVLPQPVVPFDPVALLHSIFDAADEDAAV